MPPAANKALISKPCVVSASPSEPREMLVAAVTCARWDFVMSGLYANIDTKPAQLNPIATQTNSRCPNITSCLAREAKQSACHTIIDRPIGAEDRCYLNADRSLGGFQVFGNSDCISGTSCISGLRGSGSYPIKSLELRLPTAAFIGYHPRQKSSEFTRIRNLERFQIRAIDPLQPATISGQM